MIVIAMVIVDFDRVVVLVVEIWREDFSRVIRESWHLRCLDHR